MDLRVIAVNKLQIQGTQRAFLDSYELLNRSLAVYPDSAELWALQAKLETFYLLQWNLAAHSVEQSLTRKDTANARIFRGWLAATPGQLNQPTKKIARARRVSPSTSTSALTRSEEDLQTAQGLAPTDFWPHFEMAAWLNHIAARYADSRKQYEIVEAKAADNAFLQFFFGLLLKHHSEERARGQALMTKAMAQASSLPGQAAGNLAFQAQLLATRGRDVEAAECCEFSKQILDLSVTSASVICSLIQQRVLVV
ncbi:unnamed protein product [Symbiodinium pilosum]|uniref:Uncharacterized protein n=1 Tax=Symbiodinium pilosum TaxID=2952 RepID=A0A812MS90_SYMPI|nr:unnamed protein product [Symbiodinium pilosum]